MAISPVPILRLFGFCFFSKKDFPQVDAANDAWPSKPDNVQHHSYQLPLLQRPYVRVVLNVALGAAAWLALLVGISIFATAAHQILIIIAAAALVSLLVMPYLIGYLLRPPCRIEMQSFT